MRVQQDFQSGKIRLPQRPYWEHVLTRFDMENITPRNTPLPIGIILDNTMSPKTDSEKKEMADKHYRSVLGSVMWGQLATRPDLSFSVSLLARFQANPGIEHWRALLHVVGYIKNTLDYGLTYSRGFDISPTAFVDADYGGCKDTRRSTSGYVFTMAGEPSPGAANDRLPLHYLLSRRNMSPCHDVRNRCAGSIAGWMRSKLSILSLD